MITLLIIPHFQAQTETEKKNAHKAQIPGNKTLIPIRISQLKKKCLQYANNKVNIPFL